MTDAITKAKALAKEAGVKGFRKLRLARVAHTVGKQTAWISPATADALLNGLVALGFRVVQLDTCRQLAAKGQLDCITIEGEGADTDAALVEAGVNPVIAREIMGRVVKAMTADGLTALDITPEVMARYMEADRRKQAALTARYFADPGYRSEVQGAVLDALRGGN
ncbi:MAG: hypothetical protein ACRC8D_07185 [Aeromonas sp.]